MDKSSPFTKTMDIVLGYWLRAYMSTLHTYTLGRDIVGIILMQ
jgi:hypothetical protein